MIYKVCKHCGAHLDPEEKCDCQNEEKPAASEKENGLEEEGH